jgi:hypothetical protein
LEASATGRISGESEAGFTVCTAAWRSEIDWVLIPESWGSREPNSSWDNVTGDGARRSSWTGDEAEGDPNTCILLPVAVSSACWRRRICSSW